MAEAAGVEIPKGSPEQLHSAAAAWKGLGATLEADAGRLDRAAAAVVGADWQGPASSAYSFASTSVAMALTSGGSACERAATACRQFSAALREAQQDARHAKRKAEHAIQRRDGARRRAEQAQGRITAANTAADNAAHNAATAAAAGPAGAGALSTAHDAGRAAAGARETADKDLRDAHHDIKEAEADLRAARKDGEKANDDAERAGRAAARVLATVGAAAQEVPIPGVPVPVSLRGAEVDGLPSIGDPLHGPGRFGSPGAARAAQMEQQAREAQDAADAAKPNKGTIWDGLSGLVHSATLGAVDPGGDKDSDRYRGGDLAGYIPITPMAVGKIGAKVVARRTEKKALKEAQERAAAKALEKRLRREAREARKPGETAKQARERIEQAEQKVRDDLANADLKRENYTTIVDHLDKVLHMLFAHRVPGLPEVLVEAARNWPTTKASALYLLQLAKKYLP